jgi:hypothetical protein
MTKLKKTCSKCKEEKLVREFNRHTKNADGLRDHCRSCQATLKHAYRAAHPEREHARLKAYREAHRQQKRAYGQTDTAAQRERRRAMKQAYNKAHSTVLGLESK